MSKILKSAARDLLALGGIPFYTIITARASIGQFSLFAHQLITAAILLHALNLIMRNANLRIARALILVVFTGLFYKDVMFTVFTAALWAIGITTMLYLNEKPKKIAAGVMLGAVSAAAAYYMAPHVQSIITAP